MSEKPYTTMLNAGIGMIEETKTLFDLWEPGMNTGELNQIALQSGAFPQITARRLKNLIAECFRPRYVIHNDTPAKYLKHLKESFSTREFNQLIFLFTCRESAVLYDFVLQEYWVSYSAGKVNISNQEAWEFVNRANQIGRTSQPWSESTLQRVARYLTSSLADFGLLESGQKSSREILPFRIESRIVTFLAYDLHFSGLGDNKVISHPDWGLFGLEREDVLDELKRQALKGWFIVQSAGAASRIGWQYETMEAVIDALARE